ncbi:MAG: SRPBCC domain-containing protein [Acidobacteria bacterium]|nr:SRPBCC domain-containing protein [Acidobacteriota bacterium]
MDPEQVFKALGDKSRRRLLDLLFLKDGRSLTELEAGLPMTRFGVMKHLRVLESAGLITTKKRGRETLHYLNAIPIQQVYDRWVSKYSKGWARSLTELKYDLEERTMEDNEMAEAQTADTTTHVYQIYIRTTPEKLWQALTVGDLTEKYYYGTRVDSDWKEGSGYAYRGADGEALVDGSIIESEENKRLVTTFNPHWQGADGYPESTVTFEIEPVGKICKLTLTHEKMAAGHEITQGIFRGWSEILSGLKTLLETGEALNTSA